MPELQDQADGCTVTMKNNRLLCREWVNVFEKETCTSRDTSDVAYVRNNFDVLTMLIDH